MSQTDTHTVYNRLIKISLHPSVRCPLSSSTLDTMTRLNHLKFPKWSHCVSLCKNTFNPSGGETLPLVKPIVTLRPTRLPFVAPPARKSFQAQIKQLSIHAAATTRAAVTTCFITLCTAPDRQLVRCTVYKSLRFNLSREEQRGVFQVTATGLQATQRGHAGDRDQRNLETCSVVTTRLLNKPPRVCHCSGQGMSRHTKQTESKAWGLWRVQVCATLNTTLAHKVFSHWWQSRSLTVSFCVHTLTKPFLSPQVMTRINF